MSEQEMVPKDIESPAAEPSAVAIAVKAEETDLAKALEAHEEGDEHIHYSHR